MNHPGDIGPHCPNCKCTITWVGDEAGPVQHPDQIAEQIQRTDDYIRARYGDRPIPPYAEGGHIAASAWRNFPDWSTGDLPGCTWWTDSPDGSVVRCQHNAGHKGEHQRWAEETT